MLINNSVRIIKLITLNYNFVIEKKIHEINYFTFYGIL